MPNRYLPSALVNMIEEEHDERLDDAGDEYVPEWRALAGMLEESYQEELRQRMGE
jgi:hypothetical protein